VEPLVQLQCCLDLLPPCRREEKRKKMLEYTEAELLRLFTHTCTHPPTREKI
jgi:hypothetical protein